MKEFTEDEKIIARNINKRYKWMARNKDGMLCVYPTMPVKKEDAKRWSTGFYDVCRADFLLSRELFKPIKWEDDKPTLIKNIYDPQVLDDVEKAYLKIVLKPFHDKVVYVVKYGHILIDEDTRKKEYLLIQLYDRTLEFCDRTLEFPDFDSGKMYSGMERNKEYTLDELGITYDD